jgi:YD repeat-containing protein
MRLAELSLVLDKVSSSAGSAAYFDAIIENNSLGKPTKTTRRLTYKAADAVVEITFPTRLRRKR